MPDLDNEPLYHVLGITNDYSSPGDIVEYMYIEKNPDTYKRNLVIAIVIVFLPGIIA